MAPRWSIVVGIAAISGGIAWFALRSPSATVAPAATPEAPGTPAGAAALRAPAGPALTPGSWGQGTGADPGAAATDTPHPELPPATAAVPPAAAEFGAQVRDPGWAPATEAEIKQRFAALHGARLEGAECRQDQCLLTVAGTEAEVGKTISELEGPHGLHGFARNILLTAPEQRDGKLVLRAYAMFDR